MKRVQRALRRLGGVARRERLEREGVSGREMTHAVRTGIVLRPHRGCYALPDADVRVVHAVIYRATPACVTACDLAGLPVWEPDARTHLLVPRDRGNDSRTRRPADDVCLHRYDASVQDGVLSPGWESRTWTAAGDVDTRLYSIGAGTGMNPVSVDLDLTGKCVSPVAQLVLIDAALNRGLITRGDLAGFAMTSPARVAWLRGRSDERAESPLETLARLDLVEAGLTVIPQAVVDGVGRVDLLVEDVVVVELDGRTYHSDPEAFQRDRDRDRVCALRGLVPLRYTYADVARSREQLVLDVLAALWRTGRGLRVRTTRTPFGFQPVQ